MEVIERILVKKKVHSTGIRGVVELGRRAEREDGEEEVLWGATFEIIRTFFKIVFDFSLPTPEKGRTVRRPLPLNYFSGREEKSDG